MKAGWRAFLRRMVRQAAGPTGPEADEEAERAALLVKEASGTLTEREQRRLWALEFERFARGGGDYLAVVQAAWARREGAAR